MTVTENNSVASLIAGAHAHLERHGIEDARREARLLFEIASGRDIAWQMSHSGDIAEQADAFMELVRRRGAGEPVAYLRGSKGFWTIELGVTPDTLIPRGDTETLIEALLQHRKDRSAVSSILDLGTGSGCILLAALSEYPGAFGVGVDCEEKTATQARRNARANHLDERCAFVVARWDAPLSGRFDVVFSNPPYIPRGNILHLMKDVADYEPIRALDGGEDGLDAYRHIIPALPHLLSGDGLAILEFGIGQEAAIERLAQTAGLKTLEIRKDLAGIARAAVLAL